MKRRRLFVGGGLLFVTALAAGIVISQLAAGDEPEVTFDATLMASNRRSLSLCVDGALGAEVRDEGLNAIREAVGYAVSKLPSTY